MWWIAFPDGMHGSGGGSKNDLNPSSSKQVEKTYRIWIVVKSVDTIPCRNMGLYVFRWCISVVECVFSLSAI